MNRLRSGKFAFCVCPRLGLRVEAVKHSGENAAEEHEQEDADGDEDEFRFRPIGFAGVGAAAERPDKEHDDVYEGNPHDNHGNDPVAECDGGVDLGGCYVTFHCVCVFVCLSLFSLFVFIYMKVNSDSSDEELLEQFCKSRKPEYLVELYGRYMPLVYGVALKYLKNVEDARDMVMQVYEELGGKLLQHEVKAFKGWLYVCVRNDCLMELRKRQGNFLVELDDSFMDFCDGFHPDDERETEEREEKLRECLKDLPERQRMCVERFFMEDFSYRELVEKLGFSLKMVKSFIQNGKRNLKLCLERKGVR